MGYLALEHADMVVRCATLPQRAAVGINDWADGFEFRVETEFTNEGVLLLEDDE